MTSSLRVASLPILAAGVLVSQTAFAQNSWFVEDVPDFDQRRSASTGIVGLPADGGMYCVPTSTLNWFAYLANRGTPQPGTLAGPRDWQSQDNYNRVGNTLATLGTLMLTHPQDGTSGAGQNAGAHLYNLAFCGNDFIFADLWALGKKGQKHAPSPEKFLAYHNLGGYIQTSYGRYSGSPLTRDGGHALTAIGVWDLTSGAYPIFQFRDPWTNNDSFFTQSTFRVSLAAMTSVSSFFRASSTSSAKFLNLWRLDVTEVTGNYLDSMFVIMPALGIFGLGLESGEIQVVRPFRPTGNPMPEVQSFDKPATTGPILDIAPAWDLLSYYYVTAQGSPAKPNLYRVDALTGQSVAALDNPFAPVRLSLGREDDVYLIEGPNVTRYDLDTTPGVKLAQYNPPLPAAAIAYNDLNDRVLILTAPPTGPGSRRVLGLPATLAGAPTDRALPVSLSGEVHICPDMADPDAFWVSGRGGLLGLDALAYRIELDRGTLVVSDTVTYPRSTITGLCVTAENGLILTVNDTLVELEKDIRGNWVNKVGSRWAGRRAEGRFSLARSRTNFDPATMVGPGFHNILDPFEYPSHPDCYADCDGDGDLNIFDFLCFQNKFAVRDLAADCDLDGRFTIFDFLCFQNRFSRGCE
ncbi:MAG: hypothetical protein KIT54_02700 [Phycisphaeraceae bacterium]|nr:hypothetical protein [Phycisphaeraceae bacterium]